MIYSSYFNCKHFFKQNVIQLKKDAGDNLGRNDIVCRKYWHEIYDLDFNYILSDVLENNKHIKKSYGDLLSPLQYLLILICFINTFLITLIFKELIRLFILSNIFIIITFVLFVCIICILRLHSVGGRVVIGSRQGSRGQGHRRERGGETEPRNQRCKSRT